ncbi:MAG: hypothetical protein GX485_08390 [Clostridiales bacterium]|nr:hypothetical protein [Clostridiales bacterium]
MVAFYTLGYLAVRHYSRKNKSVKKGDFPSGLSRLSMESSDELVQDKKKKK